jgi:hypothetical protein
VNLSRSTAILIFAVALSENAAAADNYFSTPELFLMLTGIAVVIVAPIISLVAAYDSAQEWKKRQERGWLVTLVCALAAWNLLQTAILLSGTVSNQPNQTLARSAFVGLIAGLIAIIVAWRAAVKQDSPAKS